MRKKESWMKKGAAIHKEHQPGKIINFHESVLATDNETYVHSMTVKLDSSPHPFPYNPNDIEPLKIIQ